MGENEYWYPKCRQAWAAQQVYRTQFWSFLYWQRNINVWSWLESLRPLHPPVKPGQAGIPRVQGIQHAGDALLPPPQCLSSASAWPGCTKAWQQGIDCTFWSELHLPSLDNWHPAMLCPSNFKYVLLSCHYLDSEADWWEKAEDQVYTKVFSDPYQRLAHLQHIVVPWLTGICCLAHPELRIFCTLGAACWALWGCRRPGGVWGEAGNSLWISGGHGPT